MIAGEDFLRRVDQEFAGEVTRHFRYPFIVLDVEDASFVGVAGDERERVFAHRCRLEDVELQETLDRLFIRLHLRAPEEPASDLEGTDRFWLRSLAEEIPSASDASLLPELLTLHFYGYKGGQARSTLLAFLSSVLATNGWRVLVIDADAEAPSADIILRANVVAPESSLVGLRAGLRLTPLRVIPGTEPGFVEMLAFRPADTRYDIDAAALAMEQSLAPTALARMARGVAEFAANKYDAVFIDHRTGLSPTVLPWVATMPGPIVVFARLDGQWRPARTHLRALWRMAGEDPGIIVSFKHDTDSVSRYRARVRSQAEELLDDLAAAAAAKSVLSDEEKPRGDQMSDHWVVWPFDSAFVDGGLPPLNAVGGQTLEAVAELRRLLGLAATPSRPPAALHRSGAQDEGDLIQTAALRALSGPNSLLFVLGRKGTGKTRLARALADASVGEPLLVADDFTGPNGVRANWAELKGLASDLKAEPIRLWWMFMAAALQGGATERHSLQARIQALASTPLSTLILRTRACTPSERGARLFLVDGLETAFDQAQILTYISALVQFMSTIDGDPMFRELARLQVFLRTDLAAKGYENFEQLSQGRTLPLEWDAQAIMNFVLSRVVNLAWFQEHFSSAVTRIKDNYPRVRSGAVDVPEAEGLLLQIFPERLRRLNLKMTTFMRTYFSDDPSGLRSFYPRIYDEFLKYMGAPTGFAGPGLEGSGSRRRVAQQLIYAAHEQATTQFLQQVRSELRYLVSLSDAQLDRLLGALRGTTTPFRLDARIGDLAQKTKLSQRDVRSALEQMLNIGIFEVRDGYPGQWRAGRLFKSSLGMLYARGDKSPDRI